MDIPAFAVDAEVREYALTGAFLFYSDIKEQKTVYASLHGISHEKGIAKIQRGVPVTKEGVVAALKTLTPEDFMPVELFDDNLLARGQNHLVWFSPPRKRLVWFNCRTLGKQHAQVDVPGLVFFVTAKHWLVFAVKGKEKPTPDAALFMAPMFNTYSDGRICVGNIDLPKGNEKFLPNAWEKYYWGSEFTHPNYENSRDTKQTLFRGGIYKLWQSLLDGKKFPQSSLAPANETVASVFERWVKHESA